MAKEFAKKFYRKKAWIVCRETYIRNRIALDGGVCEECKINQGYIVHHKITLNESNINDPDISLNHNNLMYVCKECHDQFEGHGINNKTKALCRFDVDGNPISIREIDRAPLKF